MKHNVGEIIKGYKILLTCDSEYIGIALMEKEGSESETRWATLQYLNKYDGYEDGWWMKNATEKEAKMNFFERSPLFLSSYDVYEKVKYELEKEEAENEIAHYVYDGNKEITYEEVISLQQRFDVDEVIRLHETLDCDWKQAIKTYIDKYQIQL